MGTTAATFYPHSTDWDGTDPASGDVRKMLETLPATVTGSSCDFGSSASKEITVDPYTAGRTTTGASSSHGWAINIAGADGMDSTASAVRYVPAGTWLFDGTLQASPIASAAACTVTAYAYRVAAPPSTTRTLLFSTSVNAGTISASRTSFSVTSSAQPQITLAHNETLQVTYSLTCAGQVGGLVIDFHTGSNDVFPDCKVEIPAPGVLTLSEETTTTTTGGAVRYPNPLPEYRPTRPRDDEEALLVAALL